MNKSESIANLAKALCAAQAQMECAKKDSENPFFKSHYADLSSVWDAAKGPLTENGLSVTQLMDSSEGNKIKVETVLMHSSGEWLSGILEMPFLKADPQAVGSAITYARRYALGAIVGLVTDEDDDGNKASGKKDDKKEEPTGKTSAKKTDKPASDSTIVNFIPSEVAERTYTKKDGSQGTVYDIVGPYGKYSTFSSTFAKDAREAIDGGVLIGVTYKSNQYGNTVVSVGPANYEKEVA